MTLGAHQALRQKIDDCRVGRSPISDTASIGERFSRLLESRLRKVLRSPVNLSISACEVRKLKATFAAAPKSCLVAQAESKSRPFAAAAILEDVFVDHLIETASGGRAVRSGAKGGRRLTTMDEYLSQDFAISLIDCFEDTIASPPRADGEAIKFAKFTRSVKAFMDMPDDMDVLVYDLSIQFDPQGEELALVFLVPLNVLDVLRALTPEASRTSGGGFGANPDSLWNKTMTAAACQAQLKLIGILAQLQLTIEDVNRLEPGSLIELPMIPGMLVDLKIDQPGGVANSGAVAFGILGADDGNRAVKLSDDLDAAFMNHLLPIRAATSADT